MPFLIRDAFRYGIQKTKEHYEFVIFIALTRLVILVIYGVSILIALSYVPIMEFSIGNLMKIVFFQCGLYLLYRMVHVIYSFGIVRFLLDIYDYNVGEYRRIFTLVPPLTRRLAASVLYGIVVSVGLHLFIVPGVIWGLQFYFYQFCMVDCNDGIRDSFLLSARLTRGVKWKLFLFVGSLVVLNGIAFILCGVGLFITVPLSYYAQVYVYRKLVLEKSIVTV
jgi:hypothetical protein